MSGGSGNFMQDLVGVTPRVQGSVTPIAQPGTTPAWQTAANPQQMQPNPNPYLNTFGPANMPPPVTNMGPGVNAAYNWSPQQQPAQVQQPNQQGGIGGLAQPTQQPSYQVVQPYQQPQPQPQAPAFSGGYTQKYYNRS
jgi:hypothetical protein